MSPFPDAARILQRAIVFETPEKTAATLGWTGHIPFAFWLIDVLRPKTLVELGTHMGSSYLALCQAVARIGCDTRCIAVDTWRGDEHAGFYEESVLRDLRAYHDPRYGSFSRLLQSTFDNAVGQFADRSIDLLHIDGLHTYDAVKHDFETWLPKLSPRAMVLFHDISVRSPDFEVWRFWDEISARYPSFAFPHSNGLGVLAVGEMGPDLAWLMGASKNPALAAHVRAFFGAVGGNTSGSAEVTQLTAQREQLREERGRLLENIGALHKHIAELDQTLIAINTRAASAESKVVDQTTTIAMRDAQIGELNGRIKSLLTSTSWRLTQPLRVVSRFLNMILAPGRRRTHRMNVREGHQVENMGEGRFRSLGAEPQLWLDSSVGRAPTGWALLRFEMKEASDEFRPLLYALGGAKPRWLATIPLPAVTKGAVEILIQIPRETALLRLDPSNRPGVFAFESIVIREVSPLDLAQRALMRHPWAFLVALRKLPLTGLRAFTNSITKLFATGPEGYDVWMTFFDSRSSEDDEAIKRHCDALPAKPVISVVMPVWNTPEPYLRAAIESVRAQIYPHWELCIADDASTEPHVAPVLQEYAAQDSRIKVATRRENGHIAQASNTAFALATGEFIALMDHDDVLPSHALYMIAIELNVHPEADILYSDEDKINGEGQRFEPFFKPNWDPERFYAQNYINHLGVYRASLLKAIGGFREGFEGSQDYDLALRAIARTEPARIRHIPFVLYHWRIFPGAATFSSTQRAEAQEAARRALRDHFAAKDEAVEVTAGLIPAWNRVRRHIPSPPPRVSLIVPTRDRLRLLKACVDGLLHKTDYPDLEVVIVDNESREPATLRYFAEIVADPRARVLRIEGAFNFSALNNSASRVASGAILGFINNDIEIIEGDWLTEMVAQLSLPDVGAVGAKLYYGDDTIQHAGVALGVGGVAGHLEKRAARAAAGYFGQLRLTRSAPAVTAACMIMKRAIFASIGGFNEADLAVAFNDIDLCLRIREAGYRIVWTPYAELYHLESASRGSDQIDPEKVERFMREREYMLERWGEDLRQDPYWNPNLSLTSEDVTLAYPPRVKRPWRAKAASDE